MGDRWTPPHPVIPVKAGIQRRQTRAEKALDPSLGGRPLWGDPEIRGCDGNSHSARAGAAEPLAVYIHWPFCRSKCPYCDFNSHVRDRVDAARWTRGLLADLDHHAELVPGHEVASVF